MVLLLLYIFFFHSKYDIQLNRTIKNSESSYFHKNSLFKGEIVRFPDYLTCLAWVVRKIDNAIHRINHNPLDSVVGVVNTRPVDSELSGG